MTNLLVSEIFGPTFQGEGPSIGRPCHFLRLGGCAIQCGWCDTKYTWDSTEFDLKKELTSLRIEQVAEQLNTIWYANPTPLLVISGGEPMQQQKALGELLRKKLMYRDIEIETSGHVVNGWGTNLCNRVQFNVSPKLSHARTKVTYDVRVLRDYAQMGGRFKFVVQNLSDFDEIDSIVAQAEIDPSSIWLMPLGTDRHDLMVRTQEITREAVKRQWNLTTRLHILVFGNRRGV